MFEAALDSLPHEFYFVAIGAVISGICEVVKRYVPVNPRWVLVGLVLVASVAYSLLLKAGLWETVREQGLLVLMTAVSLYEFLKPLLKR